MLNYNILLTTLKLYNKNTTIVLTTNLLACRLIILKTMSEHKNTILCYSNKFEILNLKLYYFSYIILTYVYYKGTCNILININMTYRLIISSHLYLKHLFVFLWRILGILTSLSFLFLYFLI